MQINKISSTPSFQASFFNNKYSSEIFEEILTNMTKNGLDRAAQKNKLSKELEKLATHHEGTLLSVTTRFMPVRNKAKIVNVAERRCITNLTTGSVIHFDLNKIDLEMVKSLNNSKSKNFQKIFEK